MKPTHLGGKRFEMGHNLPRCWGNERRPHVHSRDGLGSLGLHSIVMRGGLLDYVRRMKNDQLERTVQAQ